MNTINFKADNLQLETGQGVYDHEENEVVTIINFTYCIRYYEDYNNTCELDIEIEGCEQWIDNGSFSKTIKLVPSEVKAFKQMITDTFNECPTDYGLVEFMEEELQLIKTLHFRFNNK